MQYNPIFCALDLPSTDAASHMANRLRGAIGGLKVGLELFSMAGPKAVTALSDIGLPVFLDVKLHDIPNTVARAVTSLADCSPDFVTLHASGGLAMMREASRAASDWQKPPTLLAVTVLTSLDDDDLASVGQSGSSHDQVLRLTELAFKAGITGIVCSPREIEIIRKHFGADPVLMVPGIRPVKPVSDDQRRTMTPKEAVTAGANHIVVGRPITTAADPLIAANSILQELEAA